MRRFIFCTLILLTSLGSYSQNTIELNSNKWYFSDSDTTFYIDSKIKENKIKKINKYRIDNKYSDSPLLLSEYFFTKKGILNKVKSYDIHGSFTITEFKINDFGKILEIWAGDSIQLLKSRENIFENDVFIKQIIYHKGVPTRTDYPHSKDVFIEKNPNNLDSIVTLKKIDADETIQNTISYDKNGRISKSITINENGISQKKRKRKRKNKTNRFCGYLGPPSYRKTTYSYDSNGNCISVKEYSTKHKIFKETKFSYDDLNNLIGKKIFSDSKLESKWNYSIIFY